MKWTSRGSETITLKGTKEEVDAVEAMLHGAVYICQAKDRVEPVTRFIETVLEVPVSDPRLGNRFEPIDGNTGPYDDHSFFDPELLSGEFVAVYVEGIGGYNGRKQYDRNAKKLKEAGFQCLRSERDARGQYWEKWYLPGTWAVTMGAVRNDEKMPDLQELIRWLCSLQVGSISLVEQKMALSAGD